MNPTYKSILNLILKSCSHSIPVNIFATFEEQLDIGVQCDGVPRFRRSCYPSRFPLVSYSHLGHLIALEFSAEAIRREIPDLDLLDLTDEQHMLDRWLLGLFAPYRPEIASLLQQYLKSYKTAAAHKRFEIEYIREEILSLSNRIQRTELLSFICFHGNATILKQLDIATLAQRDLEYILLCSSQSSAQEIFDITSSRMQSTPTNKLLHTKIVRERLASDPVFLSNFIALLESGGESELLSEIFRDTFSLGPLFIADSDPLPTYLRNFIVGFVKRQNNPTAIGSAIHSLIYSAMVYHWHWNKSAEHLLQNLHLYNILGLVARLSAFKSVLDISNPKNEAGPTSFIAQDDVRPYPSVHGYSALMLALHCGMRPAVEVLVDAGASILTPISREKSALSLAYENIRAQHPRQWLGKYDPTSQAIVLGLNGMNLCLNRGKYEVLWVSESTDKEMLEILLKALHDRGEVVKEELHELPTWSKWGMFLYRYRTVRLPRTNIYCRDI